MQLLLLGAEIKKMLSVGCLMNGEDQNNKGLRSTSKKKKKHHDSTFYKEGKGENLLKVMQVPKGETDVLTQD